jgi:hypothetical protein
MNDEIFAEMFERYVKSPRGVAFLNNYLSTALSYANVYYDGSSGMVELNSNDYVDERICEKLNK